MSSDVSQELIQYFRISPEFSQDVVTMINHASIIVIICSFCSPASPQDKYKMKQIDKKIVINLNTFLGVHRTFLPVGKEAGIIWAN